MRPPKKITVTGGEQTAGAFRHALTADGYADLVVNGQEVGRYIITSITTEGGVVGPRECRVELHEVS